MRPDSITIKDIAKALNLSFSTVSRALKDSYQISEPTKHRVREYAKTHHYRPNLIAQSLKNKKSRSIGVILGSIPNNFFGEVISGIESVAYTNGYHVIITQSLESLEREKLNLEQLTWRSVDGILASVSTETIDASHFGEIHDNGTPIVFFDRIASNIKTHQVVADNIGGAFNATRHLIDKGYKRIAQITSSSQLSITQERKAGYLKALEEIHSPVAEEYIRYCEHGGMLLEEVEEAIDSLLALPEKPDAILSSSDRITLSTLAVLKRKGMKVPEEMAIVGFSNFSHPELFEPGLTTILQPAFDMGKRSAELLLELIESKRPPAKYEKVVLKTVMHERASSAKKSSKG